MNAFPVTRAASRIGAREKLPVLMVLLALAPSGHATNRCLTPAGKVLYTDAVCESVGAKLDREVTAPISVIPALPPGSLPKTTVKPAPKLAEEAKAEKKPFHKSPKAPVLTVCYDPKDARKDVSADEIESAIENALSLWNAGCNVNYEYMGICAGDTGRSTRDRIVDYKVWWASWDNTMVTKGDSLTFREHAIAAASPNIGVSLNRDIEGFPLQFRRSIVHEFGHVIGIGHSSNPDNIMFSGGRKATPTESDLDMCNRAAELRFGVKRSEN